MIRSETTPTIASTLTELSNVGSAPVTVQLNPLVFPMPMVETAIGPNRDAVTIREDGRVTIGTVGPEAWETLRQFTQRLLEVVLLNQ